MARLLQARKAPEATFCPRRAIAAAAVFIAAMILASGSASAQYRDHGPEQKVRQTGTWVVSAHTDPEKTKDLLSENGLRAKRTYNPIALSWLDFTSPVMAAGPQAHTLANQELVRGHILKLEDATFGGKVRTIPGLGFYEGVNHALHYEEASRDFSKVMGDALAHLRSRSNIPYARSLGVQVLDVSDAGFGEAQEALWFNGQVTAIRNDIKRLLLGADRIQSFSTGVSGHASLIYGAPHQVLPVLSSGMYDLLWVGRGLAALPTHDDVVTTLEQLGRVGRSRSVIAGALSLPGWNAVDELSRKNLEHFVSKYRAPVVSMKPPTSVQPFVISLGRSKTRRH